MTRDVPAYAIAVGVPAKVIKQRFDDKHRRAHGKTRLVGLAA